MPPSGAGLSSGRLDVRATRKSPPPIFSSTKSPNGAILIKPVYLPENLKINKGVKKNDH